MYRVSRAIRVLSAIVALPVVAFAQQTGSISGTVSSPSGTIQGARVSLEGRGNAVAIADAAGKYSMKELPAGTYQLLVTSIGFKPVRQSVTVTAGSNTTADVSMELGSLVLPGIVTTANRLPTEATRIAATVNTLEPAQIRTSPAREAQDLLREIPSIELPRTSSVVSGNAQIVSIRGVDEGRTPVLFDGIPVSDAWGEWIDWSRIPNGMLDRVEVVEGGSSSLYGNGAIGGLIQYFSRPMAPGAISAQVDVGNRDSRHAYVAAGIPINRQFKAMVNYDYADGGGYRMVDSIGPGCPAATTTGTANCQLGALDTLNDFGSIRRNIYSRLYWTPTDRMTAFVTGHAFADNRILGTPLARSSRDQRNVDFGLNFGDYPTGALSLRAYTGVQTEAARSSTIRAAATAANSALQPSCPVGAIRVCEDSSVTSTIPSHDWGASAQWSRTGWMHLESFTAGADFRHMQGAFDELDWNTSCPGTNCGKFVRKIWSGGDQALSGAFAQAVISPLTPLHIEASARVDHWDNTDALSVDSALASTSQNTVSYPSRHSTTFNPRVGVRYQALSNLSFYSAVYFAFRAPNLAELYRKQINASGSQVTLPNPTLAPERGLGREIGFTFAPLNWANLKGTYYQAEYKDFNVPAAQPVATCGGAPVTNCRQRQNISGARSEGIEATLAVRPIAPLLLSASVNYDDVRQQTNIDTFTVKPRVNRVPSPKQAIKATYTDAMFGTWNAIWRHEGHTTTLQGIVLDPYSVLDGSVQRELTRGYTGFLAVENLTDVKYQVNQSGTGASTIMSYGLPRTVRIGLMLDR